LFDQDIRVGCVPDPHALQFWTEFDTAVRSQRAA
jgi:hypothetical protein